MAELQLIDFGMLLVVTSLVAIVSRRIGLPYTAGLVAAVAGLTPFIIQTAILDAVIWPWYFLLN